MLGAGSNDESFGFASASSGEVVDVAVLKQPFQAVFEAFKSQIRNRVGELSRLQSFQFLSSFTLLSLAENEAVKALAQLTL